jgi:hypothetical protein
MALGCAGAVLVAAGCGLTGSSTKTTTVTTTVTRTVTHTVTAAAPASNACTAHDLTATFQVLPNSAGAGNIVYTLEVTNAAQAACTVHGTPDISFLDAAGNAMSEHVTPAGEPGAVVALQPGDSATAQVRFSPDVDPCDPGTATTLNVTFPGNSILATRISPATRLCGNGSLQPTAYTHAD